MQVARVDRTFLYRRSSRTENIHRRGCELLNTFIHRETAELQYKNQPYKKQTVIHEKTSMAK